MAEEMRSYIELQTQANLDAGMAPDEVRYAALRQFGSVESIKEACRETISTCSAFSRRLGLSFQRRTRISGPIRRSSLATGYGNGGLAVIGGSSARRSRI
jgi:hypothetical protein